MSLALAPCSSHRLRAAPAPAQPGGLSKPAFVTRFSEARCGRAPGLPGTALTVSCPVGSRTPPSAWVVHLLRASVAADVPSVSALARNRRMSLRSRSMRKTDVEPPLHDGPMDHVFRREAARRAHVEHCQELLGIEPGLPNSMASAVAPA